jgi:hypothetical protein
MRAAAEEHPHVHLDKLLSKQYTVPFRKSQSADLCNVCTVLATGSTSSSLMRTTNRDEES